MTGKRIIVTGGSSGIGRAVAVLIDKLGGSVILVSRSNEKLRETANLLSRESNIFPYDLENFADIKNLSKDILNKIGPIDGLVHSAGVKTTASLRAVTQNMIDKNMRVNFYSFLELMRNFTSTGSFRKGMSSVAISSVAAHRGSRGHTIYSASKAALEASVRCLAVELAPKKIRVNAVVPSIIDTSFSANVINYSRAYSNAKNHVDKQYLGIGNTYDVANVIVFLLSSSSQFITGSSIPVDGGRLTN